MTIDLLECPNDGFLVGRGCDGDWNDGSCGGWNDDNTNVTVSNIN